MKLRPVYLILMGIAFLTTILFIRTTGIHIDENNYLAGADQLRLGDSQTVSKPPLFNFINYKFYNEIARWLGPLKPVSLYLFYIVLFTWSLVWALKPLFEDNALVYAGIFIALLVSPLVLINMTQLMMETAMFPVVTLLFGAVVRGADHFVKRLRIGALAAILIAFKVTGAGVVALLAVVAFRKSKAASAALGAGAVAGYLGNRAVLVWIVQAQHAENYGGFSEILNTAAVWERLKAIRADLYVWLFFAGIAAIAAVCVFALSRWRSGPASTPGSRRITDGALLALIVGALALMLCLQAMSIHGFPRYNYPTLWLGLLSAMALIARHRVVVLAPLGVLFLFQSSPLWGTDLDRFGSWPQRTVFEFMESGGTILAGAPIHRLVVGQLLLRDAAPCLALLSIDPYEQGFYQQYFSFAFPGTRLARASESCSTNVRVWRDPADTVGGCPARCEKSNRWAHCAYQRLAFFSVRQGIALNQVCW